MIYALWHSEGRNLIGTYDSEGEALRIVHEAAERYGRDYLDTIALVQEDSRGRSTTLAMGSAALEERRQELAADPSLLTTKRQ